MRIIYSLGGDTTNRQPLDSDLLRRLYLDEEQTTWQIAEALGVSQNKVHRALTKLGWIRNKSECQLVRYDKQGRKEKCMGAHGYTLVKCPLHPNAKKNGYILEHRLVLSEHLGRPLAEDEVVHHINGDRNDNRIENLRLMKIGPHVRSHLKTLTDGELLGALRRLADKLGRPPTISDVAVKNGKLPASYATYATRFGSWSHAKALAGLPTYDHNRGKRVRRKSQ